MLLRRALRILPACCLLVLAWSASLAGGQPVFLAPDAHPIPMMDVECFTTSVLSAVALGRNGSTSFALRLNLADGSVQASSFGHWAGTLQPVVACGTRSNSLYLAEGKNVHL